MSDQKILDGFGEQLITSVRDRTIEKFEKIEMGSLKSQKGLELSKLLSPFSDEQKKSIKTLIIETTDNALFNFLDMIEQNDEKIELTFLRKNINTLSDGLSGELFTSDGWISRYSRVTPK